MVTGLMYFADKRKAQQGQWRIPEASLHLGELLGGWPGAFLAQRLMRHKVSKFSYLVIFWVIVAFWQVVAVDVFLSGRIRKLLSSFEWGS